jgi:hypothetical protein
LVNFKRLFFALVFLSPATASWADAIVRAADYDSYWLWAGVRARADIEKARTIYLLQGEVGPDRAGAVRLTAQGGGEPGPHAATLWLAYRARSLDWSPDIIAALLAYKWISTQRRAALPITPPFCATCGGPCRKVAGSA